MQELNMQEVEQVSGGRTLTEWGQDLIGLLGMVGDIQNALIDAIVDVACTATTECR
ncbi:hypothetical protein [Ramlibacter algicola]|uniref:Bacteriocin n=1 Tax=Ramlibacter algicola TaxID=2795217 RepID=A0A934UQU6_9BURK|nr:hypothetical protein [Ramlibacter algicola]MBK0392003.1 hypothetical protein [Ramlibacter algicola]